MYCKKIPLTTEQRPVYTPARVWCLAFVLLVACFSKIRAQQADVQFNVVLANVQSISVNQNQTNVSIVLDETSEFMNGKTASKNDHLQITSTSDYEIKVSASSQLQGSSVSIPVNTVGISASLGNVGGVPASPIVFSDIDLSTNQQTIVQAGQGDAQRSFNIEYAVSGGPDYLNKPMGTYTTTITYSILPN
ncbi:MAG TPA: hypothetical protein VFM65_08355 [Flavobacteriaceae bacterium]|nr:hypothetical protein [Flavobacteriaceae bacterium]